MKEDWHLKEIKELFDKEAKAEIKGFLLLQYFEKIKHIERLLTSATYNYSSLELEKTDFFNESIKTIIKEAELLQKKIDAIDLLEAVKEKTEETNDEV